MDFNSQMNSAEKKENDADIRVNYRLSDNGNVEWKLSLVSADTSLAVNETSRLKRYRCFWVILPISTVRSPWRDTVNMDLGLHTEH